MQMLVILLKIHLKTANVFAIFKEKTLVKKQGFCSEDGVEPVTSGL